MDQQYTTPEETFRDRQVGMEAEPRGSGGQQHVGQSGGMAQQSTGTARQVGTTGQQSTHAGQQYPQSGPQTAGMTSSPIGAGQHGATSSHDLKLEEALTDDMRVALHDFVQSVTACEWCADRCIDQGPGMEECIRLCRDVADLGTLNIQLISRDSIFGRQAAEVFASAAEACAQECAQHHHRHCQECAEVLSRAARSTRKMLASFDAVGTTPTSSSKL